MSIIKSIKKISYAWVIVLLFCTGPLFASTQLSNVQVNALLKNKLELEFVFTKAINGYTDKLHYQPNQLIVDIEDANSILTLNPILINKSAIRSVTTMRTENGLRLLISLKKLIPYQITKKDNILRIRFGDLDLNKNTRALSDDPSTLLQSIMQNVKRMRDKTKPATLTTTKVIPKKDITPILNQVKKTPSGYINNIIDVNFKRMEKGQGKFSITLGNSSVAVDIERRDRQLIVQFKSTFIDSKQIYIMDVLDFATVVDNVESFLDEGNTSFVFYLSDDYDYEYDQLDTLFTIKIFKKTNKEKQKNYSGKEISLNFQDIPVRTVLQLIADFNNFNLVITDSVNGNITLRLDDVPWSQALDIILKVKGLDKRIQGNILMIAPAAELALTEREKLETAKAILDFSPLYHEYIQINYAKASNIASILSSGDMSLLSDRGSVNVDKRTNTLLLKDTDSVIKAVKDMIKVLDVPIRQVIIEARIVTVNDTVGEELGIRWGSANVNGNFSTSGSLEGLASGSDIALDERLNVNLPVVGAAGRIAFRIAKLASGKILDLELSALEKENKAEIIASPRITTADQQTAYIEQGTEIPYVESASSGATAVRFKKAVLSLEVTPQITPDNKIILDLLITQDSKGDVIPTGLGQSVSINTQKIKTQVLVEDGETIVLGGIYQQRVIESVQKVPILGDIPWIGGLFRTTIKENRKSELLIFVTPRLVSQTHY
ncbi:type IV pilus secretin PilQ [Psychromonas sp. CD1]|uniref:type IV pilus secretin PilQ n=1 Tax=Psychromonas sp. CD1 TaxID=1979839 RepID=UPI000B9A1971|nr:type IV pilus secretin PilQ family protein [Psychromonas sp. CD1]